ncbi:hypothetical protein SAMN04489716_2328 [Actinoplanes derwentensis]|uniref:Uncharacterized protein n=2 Tax=Actinoplanes derwentensis TaxID=113562 RepID=A0A1H1X5P7_9ACTN|nr:hypothetical protein SAMN04489716_2328 [Actinoplanes derwentensis]
MKWRVAYAGGMTSVLHSSPSRPAARPGRAVLVVADLAELRGPDTGVVELPHRMLWLPPRDRRFDLADDYDRPRMCEIVLREAVRWDELRTMLNAGVLSRVWAELFLPRGVRAAWEQRHPVLAAVRVAG